MAIDESPILASVLHRATKELRRGVNGGAYSVADWIVDPDLSSVAGISERYWKIVGDVVYEMTAEEKSTADATALPGIKVSRKGGLALATMGYIYSHYPAPNQQSLVALLDESRSFPRANRKAYLEPALGWVNAILAYHYSKNDEIDACTTEAETMAVTWTHAALFDASDPKVSIRAALAIPD